MFIISHLQLFYINGRTTTVRWKWLFWQLFMMLVICICIMYWQRNNLERWDWNDYSNNCSSWVICSYFISMDEQQRWDLNDYSNNCSFWVICSYFISMDEQQRWDWNDYSNNCSCQSSPLLLSTNRGTTTVGLKWVV